MVSWPLRHFMSNSGAPPHDPQSTISFKVSGSMVYSLGECTFLALSPSIPATAAHVTTPSCVLPILLPTAPRPLATTMAMLTMLPAYLQDSNGTACQSAPPNSVPAAALLLLLLLLHPLQLHLVLHPIPRRTLLPCKLRCVNLPRNVMMGE